jgi:hypothetical protein
MIELVLIPFQSMHCQAPLHHSDSTRAFSVTQSRNLVYFNSNDEAIYLG